jgi:hypothetical protein
MENTEERLICLGIFFVVAKARQMLPFVKALAVV